MGLRTLKVRVDAHATPVGMGPRCPQSSVAAIQKESLTEQFLSEGPECMISVRN